jgi:hypothetical protein
LLDLPPAPSSPSLAQKTYSGFYVGNEGLPVGCAPNGTAKYLRVLERFCFKTFLRSACLEWLYQTPRSYAGYLGVSTLHTFQIYIFSWLVSNGFGHRNFSYDVIYDLFI